MLAAQQIALFQQSGQIGGQIAQAERRAAPQQVRQSRVGRQLRQLVPGRGDAALFVQRLQVGQQVARLSQRTGRRRVEPSQRRGVGHAPLRQFQRQRRQVGVEHFRVPMRPKSLLGGFVPQPVADARSQPPGPAGPLLGGIGGYPDGFQSGQAAARIEARDAGPAGIDHDADPFDGQAGLGDGRGEHDLAPAVGIGLNGPLLVGVGQIAVQRHYQQVGAGRFRFQPAQDLADFAAPRQEDQKVAGISIQRVPNGADHDGEIEAVGVARQGMPRDRINLARAGDDRSVAEQPGDRRAVQGGRHHQHPQVLAQTALAVQAEGERQIGVQAALVELVENH